jgi:disulfide bond formation protein DsbB
MSLNPFRWSFRAQFLFGFLICAGLLGFALYSEHYLGLVPCPLCMFQRYAFIALGIVCLIGGLHAPKGKLGRGLYGVLALIPLAAGIGVAGRHVWLTTLPPDKVPECGPPLAFMWETSPFADVIRRVLAGSGECAKVDWSLLGLSMPAWSLAWFVALALWLLYAAFRPRTA